MNQTEERLLEIQEKLGSWNSFVRELQVPAEIAPAMMTGRLELLKLAQPRAMSVAEVKVLYDLLGGIIETNALLQEHAQLVAQMALTMEQSMKGALASVRRINAYANFTAPMEAKVQS